MLHHPLVFPLASLLAVCAHVQRATAHAADSRPPVASPLVQGAAPQAAVHQDSARLSGVARGVDGVPLAGATVAASALGAQPELLALAALAKCDAQGRFELTLAPGAYTLSTLATAATPVSALLPSIALFAAAPLTDVELATAAADLPYRGTVLGADAKPAAGAYVHCERREDGVLLHTLTDASGAFAFVLPRGTWRAFAELGTQRSEWADRGAPDGSVLTLAPAPDVLAPPSEAALAALKKDLVRWEAPLPAQGELVALAGKVANARIVALGDALRGTHEELALGAALFHLLAEKHDFQLLALDAPFGEIWRVNEYVLGGTGDPAELVRTIGWGDWARDEVLELVRWMRTWNADAAHTRKLQITGLDMSHPQVAAARLQEYYPKVDPTTGMRFAAWLGPFRQVNDLGLPRYDKLEEHERAGIRFMLQDLVDIWPDVKEEYVKHSSEDEFDVAGAHLRTIDQCEKLLRQEFEGWTTRIREQYMHDNLAWALARCGADAKALVLARNGLTGVEGEAEFGSFGAWLRAAHETSYVSIGVCTGSGKVFVADGTAGTKPPRAPVAFTLAAPRAGTLEAALASTGARGGVLDLRALAADDAAHTWLGGVRAWRSLDSAWQSELALLRTGVPTAEFDLLVWISAVTPAHPMAPAPDPSKK